MDILAKNLLILASAGSGKTFQLGNRVSGLHRSAFGGLQLPVELLPGQWRWLGPAERDAALGAR